ncbi:MAG: hypothetical protein LW860_06705 [Xanthomonadaceae bacterium]|jgi:hypothetical protein|nr:hypothetical protein [Xanthomonadaceae bacterium]
MSRELTIEYIGPSDEDRAHLRLLMRRLGDGLSVRWRWGEEQRADALFVDPSILAGQMARARAAESGLRCVLVGAVPRTANERALARPFRPERLQQVLDAIAAECIAGDVAPRLPDEGLALAPWGDDLALPRPPQVAADPRGPTTDDAEALYRRSIDPVPTPRLPRLAELESAGLAAGESPTLRSLHRAGRPVEPGETPRRPATPAAGARAVSLRLLDFLGPDLLGGPSRIEREGLPWLVLDPKEQAFHAAAPLAALLPWLGGEIATCEWQPLTGAQLRGLREQAPARDYLHLRWLAALKAANGSLPRRLDPGGHFCLAAPFEVAPDFPLQQRIVRALAQPARLHELAAATGAPMGAVFDLVAALDAVGLVTCQPRQRLQAGAAPPAAGGLLAKAIGGLRGIGILGG